MIKQITLRNVRIFDQDEWSIQTPKLTIFCGTNSAGKSTILKTLLLLRQSQGIEESRSGKHGYLRFTGSQTDLGDFTSYVSNNDSNKEIGIGITVQGEAESSWVNYLTEANPKRESAANPQIGPTKEPFTLNASFTFTGVLSRPTARSNEQRCRLSAILKTSTFEVENEGGPLLHWHISNKSTTSGQERFDIHIPEPYFHKLGGQDLMEIGATEDNHVVFTSRLNGLLPEYIVARLKTKNNQKKREAWSQWPMPPHMNDSLGALKTALTKIHYMGPLRSPGKRFYLTHLDDRPNLDTTGETLPSILRDRLLDPIWNCSPNDSGAIEQVSLGNALKVWLHYFRTGVYDSTGELNHEEIELTITSDVLVEVKIKSATNDGFHALTDSGFGYSQVLPIIIRGLLAEKDSTTLIEQPELHLNPSLQVRLGHFFVAMIRCGKQIIAETHSEHIVNTVRVLCAEDPTRELHKDCSIIHLATNDGKPVINELSIRADGTVPRWPRDFFGEAANLTARLLRAQRRNAAEQGQA